jgi:AcrR family transcriptional regulator
LTLPKPQEDNLRVRRTQKLLREALIDLIEERGFEALTVGEITTRAMVSRAAFYRNYQDKFDLVEHIFAEAHRALFSAVDELGRVHPAEVWVAFFAHIAAYERLYRALLGSKGSPWFVRTMRETLEELLQEQGRHQARRARQASALSASAHPAHQLAETFIPSAVAAMFVEAITWWLEHDQPYPPKEMATRTSLLAAALFREASGWE